MDHTNFKDYDIASLPTDDIESITELEQSICSNTQKEIVLIAYQHTDKTES